MKRWQLIEPKLRPAIPDDLPLPHLAAIVLGNRGITSAAAVDEYLHPDYGRHVHDPFLFNDMQRVIERIERAITERQPMAVFGDYDADGVCSTVLMVETLIALGGRVGDVYLPHRETEGYGLNQQAVTRFAAENIRLLITLDCGTTNQEEVLAAKRTGIDVIVIDHHHVPSELPGALALLNPKMPNERYPFRHLASVGMAFKAAQALLRSHVTRHPDTSERWEAFEKWLLDLVAIATVTDLVPLQGENRTLLSYGLVVLNKTKRIGLRALVDVMGGTWGALDTYSLGYQIGPRINAAGRMNHANTAYELLRCDDRAVAERLAAKLEEDNCHRQELTDRILKEAWSVLKDAENDLVLVIVGDNWPVGIVGLVASRILEKFSRPTLVIGRTAQGLRGSGRSIPGFNLVEALHTMPELFYGFGGHAQACGFTLKDETAIGALRERLNVLAQSVLAKADLAPVLTIDAALALADVQPELVELMNVLQPFGMGNPKPKFILSNLRVVGLRRVGRDQQHLRLTLSDGAGTIRQAVGFNHGERGKTMARGAAIDLVAEVMMNEWNGRRDLQLRVIDFRPAASG